MRAVVDPNVLVSAVLTPRGAPAEVLRRWRDGGFELVVSKELLAELERALAYPKIVRRLEPRDAAEFVALLREHADLMDDSEAPPARSRDPGDDYLLALAEAASAVLVSGDRHLLEVAARYPVVAPRELLEGLRSS